jgi:hypothetical protein
MNCPKWHYGQVGQVGKKDHVGGFFYWYFQWKNPWFLKVGSYSIELNSNSIKDKWDVDWCKRYWKSTKVCGVFK